MQLNQIFTQTQYDEAYDFICENGYTIQEIESNNGVRQFQIVEVTQPSADEVRIAELKANIAATDAIVLEMAENALLNGGNLVMPTDADTDYGAVLSNRAAWRAELNQLTSNE